MNEILRLQYLNAMGITQYVARKPLPAARPSPVIEITLPPHNIPEKNIAAHVTTALLQPREISSSPQQQTRDSTERATSAIQPENNARTIPTDVFQCQIAIWAVEDILILADAPRLDNTQLALLRNILQAIGRSTELTGTQQFTWPLAQRKDKSLHAAREHFQGLLDGGFLQQKNLRQLLVFGKPAAALLTETIEPFASQFNYQDWPVIVVHSLRDMLEQPEHKRDVWKALQVLLRA